SPDPNINKNKKLFITKNRYELLQVEPQITQNSTTEMQNSTSETPNYVNPIKPPPPIFVKGIVNFPDLCAALIEKIGVDNFFCKSSADSLKIQTANPDAYRTLIHFLRDQNAQFHTYQLREDKPTRVVLRNLHPTTSTELIKSELELRLFEVRKVTNVLHKTSKSPLPLFFVDLEPSDHSNDIFKLPSFLHTKIKVEEPYKPKVISQCLNCQDYGHTRAYCPSLLSTFTNRPTGVRDLICNEADLTSQIPIVSESRKKTQTKKHPGKKAKENKSAIIVILYYEIFYKLVDC
ncbi:Uncharacterized protein FWK35_00020746, partial [Aphis craccivora]